VFLVTAQNHQFYYLSYLIVSGTSPQSKVLNIKADDVFPDIDGVLQWNVHSFQNAFFAIFHTPLIYIFIYRRQSPVVKKLITLQI